MTAGTVQLAALAGILLTTLVGCSGTPSKATVPAASRVETQGTRPATAGVARKSPYAPAQEDLSKRGNYTAGGLYAPEIKDSAPDGLPDVDLIPEPEVRVEPRSLYGNRSPYVVLGKSYTVLDDPAGYDETGLASFYGNKFHGRRTSNLDVYDMYAFSAAHKTLPLPSYARVTNLENGKSVIVRVNDRGPFHEGRIIDLSYAAAVKLGVHRAGTARVEVKGLSAADAQASPDIVVAKSDPPAASPVRHVATGKPTPRNVETSPASAIDHLLAALPIASANASERPPQAAATVASGTPPQADSQRFDMRQNGRTMTADEFDQWMQARRMRVATGKPSTPLDATSAPASTSAITPSVAKAPPATAASVPRTHVSAGHGSGSALTLQIASFAAHANAERALAMLADAGIGDARLLDAQANGRQVWRLRVGPIDPAAAQALVARIQGLGFGQPQPVHE
jgi:rare lipoprotein A